MDLVANIFMEMIFATNSKFDTWQTPEQATCLVTGYAAEISQAIFSEETCYAAIRHSITVSVVLLLPNLVTMVQLTIGKSLGD